MFRNIQALAAHPVYNLVNKTQRALGPKKFDRVLSVLINEKDFVIYTPAYGKEFEDIYKTTPNFKFTSEISRPVLKDAAPLDNVSTSGEIKEQTVSKYRTSCEEDFPEVFSIYATITMLPDLTKGGYSA